MSKNYEAVWNLIEQLDDISAEIGDMLEDETDRTARPLLKAAVSHIGAAVKALEDVDPDREPDDGGDPPDGSVVTGRFL